jgi:hypothetical protein
MVFFGSFSMLSGMVLWNVILPVLLDNFARCSLLEEEMMGRSTQQKWVGGSDTHYGNKVMLQVLSPVLMHLSQFQSLEHLQMMLVEH